MEELSKTNRWHYDNLTKSQEVLEQARKDIEGFYVSYAEAAKLREQLGADRTALEGFLGRVDSFSGQMPDLDARMNAIVNKLSIVDEGTQKAAALATTSGDLEQQMARIVAQQQHVDRVEGRLNALHELSGTVDGQIAEQVGRRGEIDALRNLCDGLTIQVTDARHKAEAVATLQHKLLQMATQLTALSQQLEAEQKQFKETRKSEEEIREQGLRLAELHSSLRDVAGDVEARVKQVQGLGEELGRPRSFVTSSWRSSVGCSSGSVRSVQTFWPRKINSSGSKRPRNSWNAGGRSWRSARRRSRSSKAACLT